MNAHQKFELSMQTLPLVAILRGLQTHEAIPIGEALARNQWRLIEVPLNSPSPLKSIEAMAATLPQALVGAGTVLTTSDVRNVHAAGGQFIVSPNFNADVVCEAVRLGMVCLPGVMTATEAFAALQAGATGLKLFPAEMITPQVVKALLAVLPAKTRLFPVGGITFANMDPYLAAGVSGFGIGSSLFKPGMAVTKIEENASKFIAAYARRILT